MINIELKSLDHRKILNAFLYQAGGRGFRFESTEPSVPENLEKQILSCEEQVLRLARPRAVYRILPADEITDVLAGRDILRLLDGCSKAVLIAITLGIQLEQALMKEEITNMGNAFLLDLCASEAAEEAADQFEQKLRTSLLQEGKYLTNRFSPGYGDYPLSVQRPFLTLLNTQRMIGLTLTKTNLMVPRKSITAIMGICEIPKAPVYGSCASCPLVSKCSYREHNERCYMQ
jgi:hypothetical protein